MIRISQKVARQHKVNREAYAGMRVGEIAALKIKDVANQYGAVRREIKLGSDQTKGNRSRTIVLSSRARKEIEIYLKLHQYVQPDWPLIRSQRGRAFSSLTLSMLFKEIYELAGIRTSSHSGRRTFATRLNAKGVGTRTIQKMMGHRYIATTALYCEVSVAAMRNAVKLGSGLIKSTIQERRQGRRRRGNFARAYRSELRCV